METKATAAAAGTITVALRQAQGDKVVVNRMGFGGMRLCGPDIWGWPADRENALRVLRRAVELGVNFIDTADAYGPEVNEEQIAQALYPYPDDLVIATKGGLKRPAPTEWVRDCRPERLKACCEASLRRLKLDAIELYQLHAVDQNVPFADQVGALRELQEAGKIRYIGLCNVTLEQLRSAQGMATIVSVQNRYNLNDRGESDHIVDYCEREGLAFLPWFPLAAGEISDNTELQIVAKRHQATTFQIALAWLFQRSKTMLPIPGTSSLEHLEENVAAAAIKLDEESFDNPSTSSG